MEKRKRYFVVVGTFPLELAAAFGAVTVGGGLLGRHGDVGLVVQMVCLGTILERRERKREEEYGREKSGSRACLRYLCVSGGCAEK
jgi:hypothetical protein